MPTEKGADSESAAKRTTFRPPWVKDGPPALPVPDKPWTLKNAPRRESNTSSDNPLANVQLRKATVNTKEPQENGTDKENTLIRPQLKPVKREKKVERPPDEDEDDEPVDRKPRKKAFGNVQLRKTTVPAKEPQENGKEKENTFVRPQLKPVPPKEEKQVEKPKMPPVKLNSVQERRLSDKPPLSRMGTKDEEIDRAIPAQRHALVREESMRRLSQSQHGPAPPPMPPPPPKMPGMMDNKNELNDKQKAKIEALKARPKNRPDWTAMLKEIEGNKKLKHVECNDRSRPLLPDVKETEHFLYESEKPNAHNELLKQIQGGIHLKKVKTNDRSKPMLEGLRKFRRQMTIEEQIQKSVSMASMPPEEITDEVDEMDDIDKVRDDLQSTKQMLALELRNKEAQIRENKRLLARIQNLEAELEKEKSRTDKGSGGGGGGGTASNEASEKMIKSLKTEAEQARKTSEELEKKYNDTAEELDNAKSTLEEMKRQNQALEKKLQDALQGKRHSISERKDSLANGKGGAGSDDEFPMEESSESEGEDTPEKREKKALKEVKNLRNKLRSYKNKEDNARKERVALREIIKKHQAAMKDEKKRYKALKKEVDKMAAMMKEAGDDDDEDELDEEEEEDEKEASEEESEEESSEESESEESDESEESESESEPEDAPTDKKKVNLSKRVQKHENRLAALKKANYLLKTNAERLQDDLNKQKEMTAALQEDLDSVLAELG